MHSPSPSFDPLTVIGQLFEISPLAALAFVGTVLLAVLGGLAVAGHLAWRDEAKQAGLPQAVGVALGPFFLGLSVLVAMAVLPGWSHASHLAAVVAILLMVACGAQVRQPVWGRFVWHLPLREFGATLVACFLGSWIVFNLLGATLLPLIQNDSLEYATVGRALFDSRTLATYPVIDPEAVASGFFGPWTHPPLYVALIYLGYVMQGDAAAPGLMRLIAPCFALAAVWLVFALGSLQSRLVGLFAAIVFFSTPLLFLGAQTALIDALPVLGLLLLVAVLLGSPAPMPRRQAVAAGGVLGMALWTHSQAILFIPIGVFVLLALNGRQNWKVALGASAWLVGMGLLIAFPPYAKNVMLFGSPISDNPAVFALPGLDWKGYFAFARGLDVPMAVFQYGVLKGFFALESYGVSFFLGLAGALVFVLKTPVGDWRAVFERGAASLLTNQTPWMVFILVWGFYLVGVVVSVCLGIDLMVKNERYMLVILPFVSLFAGQALFLIVRLLWRVAKNGHLLAPIRDSAVALLSATVVLASCQLLLVGAYYPWRGVIVFVQTQKDRFRALSALSTLSRARLLASSPQTEAVVWLSSHLRQDARVLSLRPADMYYSDRKMVSYLDPRLLPLYGSPDDATADLVLKRLGVGYIYATDYDLPVGYNSALSAIIANPKLTTLRYSTPMSKVYELADSGKRLGAILDISPPRYPWTRLTHFNLGGRKALAGLMMGDAQRMNEKRSTASLPFSLFHRDFSTSLATGEGGALGQIAVSGDTEYRFDFALRGRAFVRIFLDQYSEDGERIMLSGRMDLERVSEIVLNEASGLKRYARRVRTHPLAVKVGLVVEHVGNSTLEMEQVTLTKIQ